MRIRALIASISLLPGLFALGSSNIDYTTGVFIVNEDWFGHQNSTINYLLPDDPDEVYWHYRVFQAENPGMELGCTNQFGAIYNGRFYLIAKQARDGGASITGGRITVADATTMKCIKQFETIDPSGKTCDGRGFIGVNANKGYVSTTNGIWVLDLINLDILNQVKGSENPNGSDDKPLIDSSGSLYHGQTGTMEMICGKVFAAHQSAGLLVIDPDVDEVVDVVSVGKVLNDAGAWEPSQEQQDKIDSGETTFEKIAPAIGSVVKSSDGNLWLSVAGDPDGRGTALNFLIKVDPISLSTEVITIPDEILPPTNSWYAWTPDAFCASDINNVLYWKGQTSDWWGSNKVYCYDIDTDSFSLIIDLEEEGLGWKIYGCSMRVHPETDEIYMSVYQGNLNQTYVTRRYTASGELIKEYPMISNYWFPSLPVFPESGRSGVDNIAVDCDSPRAAVVEGQLRLWNLAGERVDLYDMTGRLVMTLNVNDISFAATPTIEKGIYIVRSREWATKIKF